MSERKNTRGRGGRSKYTSDTKKHSTTNFIEYSEIHAYVYGNDLEGDNKIVGLAEKSGLSDDDFDTLYDLAIDKRNVDTLSAAALEKNYDAGEVDEIESGYNALVEKSELNAFQASEVVKYASRMAQYDDWIGSIEDKMIELTKDEDTVLNTEFLTELKDEVRIFGEAIFKRIERSEADEAALEAKSRERREALRDGIKEIKEELNESQSGIRGMASKLEALKNIDLDDITESGKDAARVAKKATKGVVSRALSIFKKGDEDFKTMTLDEQDAEIDEIIDAMPAIKSAIKKTQAKLDDIIENDIDTLEDEVNMLGTERTKTARSLRMHVAAARELDFRIQDRILPPIKEVIAEAEAEGETDTVYHGILREVESVQSVLKGRVAQLTTLQATAKLMANSLSDLKDGVERTKAVILHFRDEVVPNTKQGMAIMEQGIKHLEIQKVAGAARGETESILLALNAINSASEAYDAALDNKALSDEFLLDQQAHANETRAQRQLRLEQQNERNDESTNLLLEASDGSEEAVNKQKGLLLENQAKDKKKKANDNADDEDALLQKRGKPSDALKQAAKKKSGETDGSELGAKQDNDDDVVVTRRSTRKAPGSNK